MPNPVAVIDATPQMVDCQHTPRLAVITPPPADLLVNYYERLSDPELSDAFFSEYLSRVRKLRVLVQEGR